MARSTIVGCAIALLAAHCAAAARADSIGKPVDDASSPTSCIPVTGAGTEAFVRLSGSSDCPNSRSPDIRSGLHAKAAGPVMQSSDSTQGPFIQAAQNCPLNAFCFSAQPSITSTGSTKYTRGPRYLDFELGCRRTVEGQVVYYDGSALVQWWRNDDSQFGDSMFGGHFSSGKIHPGSPPLGRFTYKLASAGNIEGPGSGPLQGLRFEFAAGDFLSGVRGRFELSEAAAEIFMSADTSCQLPEGTVSFRLFYFRIRTEMNLDLRRVPTLASANGRVVLMPQSAAEHSHGTFDMYARPNTEAKLRRLVDSYGTCLDRFPSVGSVNLTIQAIALVRGGLSDFEKTWRPPHSSHRAGENVDIGFAGFNAITNVNNRQKHYNCFYNATLAAPFATPEPGERLVLDPSSGKVSPEVDRGQVANHAHLASGDNHLYPLNQTFAIFNSSP